MIKIVYNACFGGFSLSDAAFVRYKELGGTTKYNRNIPRADLLLVQVVEELGPRASGGAANLCIRELSAGTKYRIDEYDGMESVMTIDDYDDWQIA